MAVEIFIHKMSEHMETGRIIHWLVKEGDPVEQFQIIMEVETDKVVAELEAPAAGVLKGIRPGAVDGAVVKVGETIAFIAQPGEQVPVLPPLEDAGQGSPGEAAPAAVQPAPLPPAEDGKVRATPVARRVAKELGVDLSRVKGSGPGGMIREEDVRNFAASGKAQVIQPIRPAPATPASLSTEIEMIELTAPQRMTGLRMLESLQNAPQFALTLQADMTNALWLQAALSEKILAEAGDKPSLTAMLVKVVAEALTHYPRANAAFENGRVRAYRQVNIGIAVGTDAGLVVPVIKQADQKSLGQVVKELKAFQEKARQMRFGADDLIDGTFTISNLGMYGIEQFNAILNPPQSAILAVGRVVKIPVGMPDDTVALRPMIKLTLTVDHRVLDGVQGARFLSEVKDRLEQPYFLL